MSDQPETDTELEDTEGHKHRIASIDEAGEPDDTEGHKHRIASVDEGEPDDTEGHSHSHKR